jgi:tetratricopeptide (TPR) repeat protein
MRFHFLGDRTERAFTRGQRHLERWSFDEAVRAFDSAIDSDPAYPHLYMYKGLALAELGRLEDAVNAVDRAAELQSTNFVFPMYLGCIHLDEGQTAAAAQAFAKAAALAPTNPLVSSYRLLADYLGGDKRALHKLTPALVQTPDGFKARLLLALPGWSELDSGDRATTAPPAAKVQTRGGLASIRRWIDGWETRRLRRRAHRLFAKRRYETVLDLLRDGQAVGDLDKLAERARTEALKELSDQIDRLGTNDDKQRRSLLIRRADLRLDDRARYRDLEQWVKSYRQSDSPKRARPVAADVFAAMADIDRRLGRHEVAIRMCEQSRVEGASGEVDWIEAQVRAATGPYRHARRLLERFARSQSLSFDARVKDRMDRKLVSTAR